MPTDDAIRASDADREHAVGLLRDGYACGRITLDEFDERTTAAFTSRTWGELRKLTQDLPAPGQRAPLPAAPAVLQQARGGGDRPPRAVPASDGPALIPVVTIALFWLALTFTAHAAGALIPVVLIVLMAVQMAGRVRCGLGSVDRSPPDQPPPPGGGPEAR
jgi:hypothetical protein